MANANTNESATYLASSVRVRSSMRAERSCETVATINNVLDENPPGGND